VIEIPVQVIGKVRSRIQVAPGASEDEHRSRALADDRIRAMVDGKEIRKVVVIPGRLVSLVIE
jgi:leucyl-tRNA synthetase